MFLAIGAVFCEEAGQSAVINSPQHFFIETWMPSGLDQLYITSSGNPIIRHVATVGATFVT